MITVSISINSEPLFARTAVRREEVSALGTRLTGRLQYRYELDDGSFIEHYYNDGAIVLAKKMLDTIKEQR